MRYIKVIAAYLAAVTAMSVIIGCNGGKRGENSDRYTATVDDSEPADVGLSKIVTKRILLADSVVLNSMQKALIKIDGEYPVGNELVADSIRDYLNRIVVGGNSGARYKSYDDGLDLMKSYVSRYLTGQIDEIRDICEDDGNDNLDEYGDLWLEAEETVKFGMLYCTPQIVTYCSEMYVYSPGAAHGMSMYSPATFVRSTGRLLEWDDVLTRNAIYTLRPILLKELKKQYFSKIEWMSDYDDISDMLLIQADELELPAVNPELRADGIVFIYQPYEIAPYAAGIPRCTLSYKQLEPVLTSMAKSLVSESN